MDYRKIINDWIIPIVSAVIIALLIRKFIFFQIEVPTTSMYPTIKAGDRIIATKIYDKSKLKRGDIVVFYSAELNDTLIKRLIGLPGDYVEIKDGSVFINEVMYEEPYVVNKDDLGGSFEVPEGSYLFMGDNRAISYDSRRWANPYIEGKYIEGKAQFISFPFKRFGKFVTGRQALIN
jgi:signal peptidase I, bacterial type